MKNLKDLQLDELEQLMVSLGEAKFRAKQIFGWLYSGSETFEDMFNIPAALKRKLQDKTTPRLIQFHTLKNAANPPFLGGFSIFGTVAA